MGDSSDRLDYEALFRGTPTPVVVLDPDLRFVEANDAYLAATMRSRDDLVGRPFDEAFPDNPDDPDGGGPAAWGASLRRVLRERVTDVMAIQKYDIPQVTGGFATRYWAPVNAPILGPDGEIRWIVHRTEDVTAYMRDKRAGALLEAAVFDRRRLEQDKQTLTAVVDSLDVAVVGCDGDGRPVLTNEAARRLVGDRLDGVPVAQWPRRLHLHHPDGSPMAGEEQPLVRALAGERVRDVEVVVRPPGKPQRIFRVNGRPVTGRPGLAAVVAMHDVTVHRRAARLRECEFTVADLLSRPDPADELIHEAVRVIGGMIGWAATEFWDVDEVAGVLRRMARWTEAGRNPPAGLPEPLSYGQGLPGRAWQTTQPVWAEDRGGAALAVPIPSGSTVLGVLVCYGGTTEAADDVWTAVLVGISAHIGEMLERRRAERLVAELDRTRDDYIALVGHELRTPLTSMQAYAEMMLDEPGLTGEHREMLEVVRRNSAKLHTIVLKLLDVAGMRSGRADLDIQRADLAAVVHAAVDAARDETDIPVVIEVNTPDTVPLDGDPDRLRQVVDELLANALTWAGAGSVVGVQVHADDRTTSLAVSNTGAPIPGDERAHLFDLFFRGGAAAHQGVPGSGLGLTLARAIVDQHGGTIAVSEPDEAVTTFTVRLPTRHPAARLPDRHPAAGLPDRDPAVTPEGRSGSQRGGR
ncbi:ATP-binding protein [Actinoplanes sp. NPDC023714]|uniref:PAS domain-containing sensor histidine kinase n=1 Tax=Actinoplanes sp. NPDC023714 TaxID=3154322 RepID=UPI0033CDCC2D